MSFNVTEYPPQVQYIIDNPTKTMGTWFCGGFGDFLLMGAILSMTAGYWVQYGSTDALLIVGFGDYISAAYSSPWYTTIEPLTAEVVLFVSQMFFIVRLWRMLGGLRFLLVPLVPTMLMGLSGFIAITIQIYMMSSVETMANLTKTFYVASVGVVASDVIVTVASSYYLNKFKTGYKRTDSLIARLLHLTWVTAAFPMICSTLNLIFYVTLSSTGNSTFIAFNMIAPKLYTVSMLYTLNSRQALGERDSAFCMSTDVNVNITSDTVRFTDGRAGGDTSLKFANPETFVDDGDDTKSHPV
ncbi:hypothetical protein AURDEDRAFT_179642 [Auricularia subglabra TFB-10046 SS5]|nr:hypothetical protein AURDEDRAFT_179642 [Auricularia subglabra TFB-10046 SS5]